MTATIVATNNELDDINLKDKTKRKRNFLKSINPSNNKKQTDKKQQKVKTSRKQKIDKLSNSVGSSNDLIECVSIDDVEDEDEDGFDETALGLHATLSNNSTNKTKSSLHSASLQSIPGLGAMDSIKSFNGIFTKKSNQHRERNENVLNNPGYLGGLPSCLKLHCSAMDLNITKKSISFYPLVRNGITYSFEEYPDRKNPQARMSMHQKIDIRNELITFKLQEMEVHPESADNMNLHDYKRRKQLRTAKLMELAKKERSDNILEFRTREEIIEEKGDFGSSVLFNPDTLNCLAGSSGLLLSGVSQGAISVA
eukprot:Pgem_evm1s3775